MLARKATLSAGSLCLLAAVSCVLLAGCGSSDGVVATVQGIVADDSTLAGLPGARVEIGARRANATGINGTFALAGVGAGTQTVTVSVTGYETVSGQVTLLKGDNNIGTICLPHGAVAGMGHIKGMVQDSGVPAAGATVDAGGRSAMSKADGSFALYNINPGMVTVQAQSSSGTRTGTAVVSVVAGTSASATINLEVRPPSPPPL